MGRLLPIVLGAAYFVSIPTIAHRFLLSALFLSQVENLTRLPSTALNILLVGVAGIGKKALATKLKEEKSLFVKSM